jgi:hypothetical protein
VVICLGSTPNIELVNPLHAVTSQFIIVGDACKPRKVTEAMVEGALAGLHIDQPGLQSLAA